MCKLSLGVYAFILKVIKFMIWSCVGMCGCIECIGITVGSDVELIGGLVSICQNNCVDL